MAIASMPDADLVQVREYHLACLCKAARRKDSDTLKVAILWVVVLTEEMTMRGGPSGGVVVQG